MKKEKDNNNTKKKKGIKINSKHSEKKGGCC
jgi:hypothetical protein